MWVQELLERGRDVGAGGFERGRRMGQLGETVESRGAKSKVACVRRGRAGRISVCAVACQDARAWRLFELTLTGCSEGIN